MDFQISDRLLCGSFLNRSLQHGERVSLLCPWKDGRKTSEFHPYTWNERLRMVEDAACGLLALGVQPGERVAVIGPNRLRWLDGFWGTLLAGGVVVTVYPTLTAQDMAVILADSGARFAFVSDTTIRDRVIAKKDQLPALEKMIIMDPYKKTSDEVIGHDDLYALGAAHRDLDALHARMSAQQPDDVAVLIYTSGTTGEPKGVMLTNANFDSQRVVTKIFAYHADDVWLNHIPLCHSFGLTGDMLASGDAGGTLALASGIDPEELRASLAAVRPTVLISVPRLYEKMFLKITSTLAQKPPFVQGLFAKAHAVGREMFKRYTSIGKEPPLKMRLKHRLADRVLSKVRKQAGFENIRVAYAGGGPISAELVTFFQGLGIDIYQGFGLTETSPVVTVNRPGKNKLGSVGPALPNAEVKIAPDGEIMVRGPMVMKGYWNKPGDTTETIESDGWMHTGDIGHLDNDGYLFITDRKKEIIVTSGGKNIAPTRIENLFNMDPLIEKVVVIGNARKFLAALICPNFEELVRWAKANDVPTEPVEEMVEHSAVTALYRQSVERVNEQLARFETIKRFAVMDHVFDEHHGELTATQKVKRRIVDEKYKELIDSFYIE
ncbi:MAG TPA: long-chain fatty acid--CoA ligase [bacterium]|nr:long-chain fatty acid--CoA ligase [bacterium]